MRFLSLLILLFAVSCYTTAKHPIKTGSIVSTTELAGKWMKEHLSCVPQENVGDPRYEPGLESQATKEGKPQGYIVVEDPPTKITLEFEETTGKRVVEQFRKSRKPHCTRSQPYSYSLTEGTLVFQFGVATESGKECEATDFLSSTNFQTVYNETSHTLYLIDKDSTFCKGKTDPENTLKFVGVFKKI